jgi:hypothetical protein
VQGFVQDDKYPDVQTLADECEMEFNKIPNVVRCKHLGKAIEGKNQPVLYTLSTSDEAAFLVANAKRLRESNDELARSCIQPWQLCWVIIESSWLA